MFSNKILCDILSGHSQKQTPASKTLILLLFSLKLCVYTYDQPSNSIVITFLETISFAWGVTMPWR